MNWKFDFSPDTSDMMGNWSLGECRLVVLVGGWCREAVVRKSKFSEVESVCVSCFW